MEDTLKEIRLVEYIDEKYSIGMCNLGYNLIIRSNLDTIIENEYNATQFNKSIENESDEECKKLLKYAKGNYSKLLDEVKYIRLDFDYKTARKYYDRNKLLHNKKVVVGSLVKITDKEELEDLIKTFKGLENDIYIQLEGNTDYVTLYSAKATLEVIAGAAEKIDVLNISPLEKVMIAYDYVVQMQKNIEDSTKDEYEARDLTRVLFGAKIVCAGFAHVFEALLHYLNIKSEFVLYSSNISKKGKDNKGHARTRAYIKDEKYNIDGVYYFDPALDCDAYCTHVEESYRHFLKTKKEIDQELSMLVEDDLCKFDSDLASMIDKMIGSCDPRKYRDYVKSINNMSKFVCGKSLFDSSYIYSRSKAEEHDIEKIKSTVSALKDLFERPISGEKYIKLLLNVKIIESTYKLYDRKYDFADIVNIAYQSGWDLSKDNAYYVEENVITLKGNNMYHYLNEEGLLDNVDVKTLVRKK